MTDDRSRLTDSAERYIKPQEAADYLGVTRQAIYQWIREGRITARRFGTKRGMRILLSELKRFEESSIIRSATKEQTGGDEATDNNRMPRLAAALHT